MGKHYPAATGPEADKALEIVRTEAQQVCKSMGIRSPTINIVASLRSSGDNTTADMKPARRGGGYEMNMPLRVVQTCPPAALRWLVAHEIGHQVTRNSFQERLRGTVMAWALLSGALWLGTTVAAAWADLSGVSSHWITASTVAMISFLLSLLWVSALRRADERRADRFAASFLGDVQGAEEYFAFTNAARSIPTRVERLGRAVMWPLRLHPSHSERLELMRAEVRV